MNPFHSYDNTNIAEEEKVKQLIDDAFDTATLSLHGRISYNDWSWSHRYECWIGCDTPRWLRHGVKFYLSETLVLTAFEIYIKDYSRPTEIERHPLIDWMDVLAHLTQMTTIIGNAFGDGE